jgi:galactose-1-phosphate uridylyltransferase
MLIRNLLNVRGQQEAPSKIDLPQYDPSCYLCPGNKRAQGDANPKYETTFVFVNDYSAVKEEQAEYQSTARSESKQSHSELKFWADMEYPRSRVHVSQS